MAAICITRCDKTHGVHDARGTCCIFLWVLQAAATNGLDQRSLANQIRHSLHGWAQRCPSRTCNLSRAWYIFWRKSCKHVSDLVPEAEKLRFSPLFPDHLATICLGELCLDLHLLSLLAALWQSLTWVVCPYGALWSYAVLSLPGKEQAAPESWIWPGRNWCWVVRHLDCMNIHGPCQDILPKKFWSMKTEIRKHHSLQRRPSVMPATDSIPGRMRSVLHTKRWASVAWETPTHGASNLLRRFESVLLYFVLWDQHVVNMLQVVCEGNWEPYLIRGDYLPSSHCKAAQPRKGSLGQVAALQCSCRAGSLGSSGSCWQSVQPVLSQKVSRPVTSYFMIFHALQSGKQKRMTHVKQIHRYIHTDTMIESSWWLFIFAPRCWDEAKGETGAEVSRAATAIYFKLHEAGRLPWVVWGCSNQTEEGEQRPLVTRSWYH